MNDHLSKNKKRIKIFDLVIVLLILILGFYFIFDYAFIQEKTASYIGNYGLASVFIFSFLMDFLPQFISPDYGLLIAIIFGMNIYSSLLMTILGSAIGSYLAFLIGYHKGQSFVYAFLEEKTIIRVERFWRAKGKIFVLISAIVPLVPAPFMPLIFGSLQMRKIDFVLWGILPRALGFIGTALVAEYLLYLI